MLVKISDAWVDPTKVSSIVLDKDGKIRAFVDGNCISFDGDLNGVEEFASIVNSSIFTQSFGGENAEEGE